MGATPHILFPPLIPDYPGVHFSSRIPPSHTVDFVHHCLRFVPAAAIRDSFPGGTLESALPVMYVIVALHTARQTFNNVDAMARGKAKSTAIKNLAMINDRLMTALEALRMNGNYCLSSHYT
jgi:hypothetical protein